MSMQISVNTVSDKNYENIQILRLKATLKQVYYNINCHNQSNIFIIVCLFLYQIYQNNACENVIYF